jgi:hypothetical protein
MVFFLKGIKAYEIQVDVVSPAENADSTEVDAYDHLCYTASTIFIQVVLQDILEKIVQLDKPHLMWIWLPTEYYRDLVYALDSLMKNLVSLAAQYSGNNLSDFIYKFQCQSFHLTTLSTKSSVSYQKTFAAFLGEEKAKSNFLTGFMVKHNKNMINNLITKDSLSYADIKQ